MSFNRIRKGIGQKVSDGLTKDEVIDKLKRGPELDKLQDKLNQAKGAQVPEGTYIHQVPTAEGQPSRYDIHELENVRKSEYGIRTEGVGGLDGLKRALRGGDIRASARDKRAKVAPGVPSAESFNKKLRKDLVTEHLDGIGTYNTKTIKKTAKDAEKLTPASVGARLARQLMKKRNDDMFKAATSTKDYGSLMNNYENRLLHNINSMDIRSIPGGDEVREALLNNIRRTAEVGLDAVKKTYSRGVKKDEPYKAPSRTKAFIGSGEYTTRKLVDDGILEADLDGMTVDERDEIFANIGSIIEQPLDDAGMIVESKRLIAPEDVEIGKSPDLYERNIASVELSNLLETRPTTSINFSKTPTKWTKARQGAKRLVKTHDDEILKNLTEESAPEFFKGFNHISGTKFVINQKQLDYIKQLQEQGKLKNYPDQNTKNKSLIQQQQRDAELKLLREEFKLRSGTTKENFDNFIKYQKLLEQKYGKKTPEYDEKLQQLRDSYKISKPLTKESRKLFDAAKEEIEKRYPDVDEATAIEAKADAQLRSVQVADYLKDKGEFSIEMFADIRSRGYYELIGVNPQEGPVGRSVLQFGEGKPLNDDGVQNLKTAIASKIELSDEIDDVTGEVLQEARKVGKEPHTTRLDYFNKNEDMFYRWSQDPVGTFDEWSRVVDEKEQMDFMAMLGDYNGWRNDPNFVARVPIGKDATTSGIQIITALFDDDTMAHLVNLVATDIPGDTYIHVANNVKDIVSKIAKRQTNASPEEVKMAQNLLNNGQFWENRRKAFKRPTMVFPYGGGADTLGEAIFNDLGSSNWKPTKDESLFLGKIMANNMVDIIPSMGRFKNVVKALTDLMFTPSKVHPESGNVQAYSVNAPTFKSDLGFTFKHDYPDFEEGKQIKVTRKDGRVSLSPQRKRDDVRPTVQSKATTALMANIIHFLDAQIMWGTGAKMADIKAPMAAAHDQFSTHPNDVPAMTDFIRQRFKELFGGKKGEGTRLLEKLIEQGGGDVEKILEDAARGKLDIDDVIDNAHPFDY